MHTLANSLFDLILYVHQQSFSYAGTGLPGLNQYQARINVSCSRPQGSDAGEARTRSLSVSSQALYHRATALPTKCMSADFLVSFHSAWSGSKLFEKVISISQKLPLARRELTSLMLLCQSIVGREKFYYFVGAQWLSGRVLSA